MALYVSNTRYTPMLGNSRASFMVEDALPYDAEVEYLQSSGTQYINTGIVAKYANEIAAEIMFNVDERRGYNNSTFNFFGANSWWNGGLALSEDANYPNNGIRASYGNAINSGVASSIGTKYIARLEKGMLTLQGTQYTFTSPNSGFINTPVFLFGCNRNGTFQSITGSFIKVYSFKIYENSSISLDFIPVRVGTTGYMYDRVSKQLFGNSGTGSFVLGNDKN